MKYRPFGLHLHTAVLLTALYVEITHYTVDVNTCHIVRQVLSIVAFYGAVQLNNVFSNSELYSRHMQVVILNDLLEQ